MDGWKDMMDEEKTDKRKNDYMNEWIEQYMWISDLLKNVWMRERIDK